MGAYRAGADPQLDRAITMHEPMTAFLCQPASDVVQLTDSIAQLAALLQPEGVR